MEVEGLGGFVRDGNSFEADATLAAVAPVAEAPPELLAEVLLGPLLALALAQRGVFLLHAGGCEVDGDAFLFLGESGAGKSTLAARLGAPRLADDQAAIDAVSTCCCPTFRSPSSIAQAQRRIALAVPAGRSAASCWSKRLRPRPSRGSIRCTR